MWKTLNLCVVALQGLSLESRDSAVKAELAFSVTAHLVVFQLHQFFIPSVVQRIQSVTADKKRVLEPLTSRIGRLDVSSQYIYLVLFTCLNCALDII